MAPQDLQTYLAQDHGRMEWGLLSNHPETFEFGDNWSRYAGGVELAHVEAATEDLLRLLPELGNWSGAQPPRFVDVGCGSGVHSIAAARLGARVMAFDVDRGSVATTQRLVERFQLEDRITVVRRSILDNQNGDPGNFDFVYSWGVLHHTGDLWRALDNARSLLSANVNGRLAVALYRPTRLDPFWVWEKRRYNRLGATGRHAVETVVSAAWDGMRLLKGVSPRRYRAEYVGRRGMTYDTDLKDWLGGYPYEACSDAELRNWARSRNLRPIRDFVRHPNRTLVGIAGSGCDEFVFGPA